jgi:hypothetical protein
MLGTWLTTQRVDFEKGKLGQVRQERLELLGVLWDPLEAQWVHNFGLLSAYRAREVFVCTESDPHATYEAPMAENRI